MPPHFDFQYRFHAAGQGIFASGTVAASNDNRDFNWVFDCGSTTPVAVLKPAISSYKRRIGDHIDLLCISHFDNDHVSGLADLLEDTNIGTVVIPYCWFVERLAIGAIGDHVRDDYYDFIADPVSFVLKRAVTVNSVLIVGAPLPDSSNGDQNSPFPTGSPDRNSRWHLKFERFFQATSRTVGPAAMKLAKDKKTAILTTVSEVSATLSNATAPAGWEFMFFHKPIDRDTRTRIDTRIRSLMKIGTNEAFPRSRIVGILKSPAMRKQVRDIYEHELKRPESVNSTSLCVYTGPCLNPTNQIRLGPPKYDLGCPRIPTVGIAGFASLEDKCSILYTGDANFKVDVNRQQVRSFLTDERWAAIAILQIPHHGSRNNWKVGSAHEFSHQYSVFCAHEKHKKFKHPHKVVVDDLAGHGFVLANKSQGCTWDGQIISPPKTLS